jgi:integrase
MSSRNGFRIIRGVRNDFFKAFINFVEVHRSVKAERTTTSYYTTINFLKRFEKERHGKITFDNFNLELFEKVRDFAYKDNGYTSNYFATSINKLKAFLNWATDRGLNYNLAYRKFKAPEVETTIVCLYQDELFALYGHDFKSKRLNQVRDVYCFGCFTGLRYSDIKDLRREHIKGDELQKTIIKTKQFLKIPLNKFALEILEKYQDHPYGPLPRFSSQKFNEYVKEACSIAKINSPVTVINYSGGRVMEKTVPKYELITSHTARKTFATNSLIFGMSETAVKRVTGHKKDQSFQRYVNFADQFLKEQTNAAWNGRRV